MKYAHTHRYTSTLKSTQYNDTRLFVNSLKDFIVSVLYKVFHRNTNEESASGETLE